MNRATFPAKTVSRVGRLPRQICPALKILAGVNLIHVPYRGGVTGLPDLLAGQVNVAPQRDLRGRGRGTGSRESCPNVWAYSDDGVAPGAPSCCMDCSEVGVVDWIGNTSPNSSRWGPADGARMTLAASLASLASSILTLISRRRRTRASPISPAPTNISVVLRSLKLPNSCRTVRRTSLPYGSMASIPCRIPAATNFNVVLSEIGSRRNLRKSSWPWTTVASIPRQTRTVTGIAVTALSNCVRRLAASD